MRCPRRTPPVSFESHDRAPAFDPGSAAGPARSSPDPPAHHRLGTVDTRAGSPTALADGRRPSRPPGRGPGPGRELPAPEPARHFAAVAYVWGYTSPLGGLGRPRFFMCDWKSIRLRVKASYPAGVIDAVWISISSACSSSSAAFAESGASARSFSAVLFKSVLPPSKSPSSAYFRASSCARAALSTRTSSSTSISALPAAASSALTMFTVVGSVSSWAAISSPTAT